MTRWLGLMLAMGCAAEPPGTPESAELEQAMRILTPTPAAIGGCADVVVYGRNANDSAGIVFQAFDGLVADAQASGSVTSETYQLPDPAVTMLEVRVGPGATFEICNDIGGQPVNHIAVAIGGEVEIEVDPSGPWATARFSNLTLEDQTTGNLHELPFLEIADVLVGWLPG